MEDIKDLIKKAEAGDIEAQFDLAVCYNIGDGVPKDRTIAKKWWQKAAEQGCAESKYYVGAYYMIEEKNHNKAFEWLLKAAEQGQVDAQQCVGAYYQDGCDEVPQDHKKAVYWHNKAAEQGHSEAEYNLGVCYWYGYGVEVDKTQSKKWFEKAAAQGDEMAITALRDLSF